MDERYRMRFISDLLKRMNQPKRKKMLIVNDLLHSGGVETLLNEYIHHFKDEYAITVLFSEEHLDLKNKISGVKYYNSHSLRPYTEVGVLNAKGKQLSTKKEYDVLLALKSGAIMDYALRFNAKKKIGFVHHDYDYNKWTIDYLHKYGTEEIDVMTLYDSVVCVSQKVKESVIRNVGDSHNLIVLYNPVNIQRVLDLSKAAPMDLLPKKKDGVVRFVMCGNIAWQKAYDRLIEALEKLDAWKKDNECLDYEVVVIGSKDRLYEEETIASVLEGFAANPKIHYLGYLENPFPYYLNCDWFLSTSRYEGYSLSLQEAMLLDMPILSTKVAGADELLDNGNYGILMEHDVDAIFKALRHVLLDPALKEYYVAKSKERKSIIKYTERFEELRQLMEGE